MAASYPNTLKIFQTFSDYSDIIFAISVNEIHDEVVSLESTLGANPLTGTGYTSVGQGLQDLFTNKADANHTHTHASMPDDGPPSDDHPQYMRTDGRRDFTGPVQSPWASLATQLMPKGQLDAQGFINTQTATGLINGLMSNYIRGALPGVGNNPVAGPAQSVPQWKLTGGTVVGVTDGNGWLPCSFGSAFAQTVQAFVATKIPTGAVAGHAAYAYVEAQLTLVQITTGGAQVAFSHDYSFQRSVNAAYNWIAIGR